MPIVSVGDLSQHFQSLQNSGRIKSDLAKLGQELSTGKVADVVEKVGGQTRQLAGVEHSLKVLDSYQRAAVETTLVLDHMQFALDRVDENRVAASATLLMISDQSQKHQLESASSAASHAFQDMVSALNSKVAGRALFGGVAVDRAPLASANDMLSDLRLNLVGVSSEADFLNIVDTWFNDPAGGFASIGYQGDMGPPMTRSIAQNENVEISGRADSDAVKRVLHATALGALSNDGIGMLTQTQYANIPHTSGVTLLGASSGMVATQTEIGQLQNQVEAAQTRLSSEQTSLGLLYNDITSADPFETATRLQAVQTQLETHFAVTARLSQMTLADYI